MVTCNSSGRQFEEPLFLWYLFFVFFCRATTSCRYGATNAGFIPKQFYRAITPFRYAPYRRGGAMAGIFATQAYRAVTPARHSACRHGTTNTGIGAKQACRSLIPLRYTAGRHEALSYFSSWFGSAPPYSIIPPKFTLACSKLLQTAPKGNLLCSKLIQNAILSAPNCSKTQFYLLQKITLK